MAAIFSNSHEKDTLIIPKILFIFRNKNKKNYV